jgi:hypothetical protein
MNIQKDKLSFILLQKMVFFYIKLAMKFWIGAAANIATVSVVWAQLFI